LEQQRKEGEGEAPILPDGAFEHEGDGIDKEGEEDNPQ
jgi:hypothetical protein